MNSSTSASDPAAERPRDIAGWRRFILWTIGTAIVASIVLLLAAVALDPFDTGFGLVRVHGTFAKGPRLGHVSRLRDPDFDSAIFGNSHIMSLSPARLSEMTGRRFVMFGVPGTGVPEQMTLLDAYLVRHGPPRTLLFGIDALYCLADPRALPPTPFPDWLYADDRLRYAAGLFRWSTLAAMGRRLGLIAGLIKPAPRDGTFDLYEGEVPDPAVSAARIAAAPRLDLSIPAGAERAGLRMLGTRLKAVPPDTQVVLLLPPVAARTLPLPGTPAETALAACKQAVADLAAARPGTQVVDWLAPRPGTEVTADFRDPTHIYAPLARAVEADIARALKVAP